MTKHWLWNHIILDSILACSPGTYSAAWVLELSCFKSHLPYLLNKKEKKGKSLSHVWLFATPWTVAHQPPLSMGFSRQEYWSGLPFPSPNRVMLQKAVVKIIRVRWVPSAHSDCFTTGVNFKKNEDRNAKRYFMVFGASIYISAW